MSDKNYNKKLIEAINYKNGDEIEKYLNKVLQNKTINKKDKHGDTILHRILDNDKFSIIKRLIDVKADVNILCHGQSELYSYLSQRSWRYDYDMIKLLLDSGADVNKGSPIELVIFNFFKPYNYSLDSLDDMSENLTIIQLLLENGAKLNNNVNLYTPEQHWRTFDQYANITEQCVELLYKYGYRYSGTAKLHAFILQAQLKISQRENLELREYINTFRHGDDFKKIPTEIYGIIGQYI